jgi:ATP-dependent Lon protease
LFLQTLILFEKSARHSWRRQESFDLQGARRLLDEDHRGLEKVRIIQRLGHLIVVYSVLMVTNSD